MGLLSKYFPGGLCHDCGRGSLLSSFARVVADYEYTLLPRGSIGLPVGARCVF